MRRIFEIQQELKAPKNQKNNFGGYNYRSCEDILEAVKPLLKKHNLGLFLQDEIINTNDRYYVKATASIFDEEKLLHSVSAYAREEETKKGMDASQITGAASSYARKYALNGLFAIDDTKDADATNTHGKEVTIKVNPDIDIIEGLKACDTLKNVIAYKDKYKTKVVDIDNFKKEYTKVYTKLQKGAEDVKNNN